MIVVLKMKRYKISNKYEVKKIIPKDSYENMISNIFYFIILSILSFIEENLTFKCYFIELLCSKCYSSMTQIVEDFQGVASSRQKPKFTQIGRN